MQTSTDVCLVDITVTSRVDQIRLHGGAQRLEHIAKFTDKRCTRQHPHPTTTSLYHCHRDLD